MSDADNLRDRIAEIVNAALVAWSKDMDTQGRKGKYVAQAIIDEFGLTVETGVSLDELPEHLQGEFIDDAELIAWAEDKPKKSRVVGKWVKQ